MEKIGLRVDVDGYYGLTQGVPNLFNLFEDLGISATFFFNMGREANIFEVLKYKNKKSTDTVKKRYSKLQLMRMLLLPRKLGCSHPEILQETKRRGNMAQIHAWSHIKWGNALSEIDPEVEIRKMVDSYKTIFGRGPMGFAPSQFSMDERVIPALKANGLKYVSSEFGDKPKKTEGIWQIPLSYSKTIEESGVSEFRSSLEKRGYKAVYIHADWEGLNPLETKKALEGYNFTSLEDLVKLNKNPK